MKDTQYTAIAGFYDEMNPDADYKKYAAFADRAIRKYSRGAEIVLDAACGTGKMIIELSRLGYDLIGSDISYDMLSEAMINTANEGIHPLLLNQDIRELDLYGTVDAAVCCFDSLNYLIGDGDLEKCFKSIHLFMMPDGIFVFDMNTPYKFENVYGDNDYILESDGALCAWSNSYDKESGICEFSLSFFREEEDGRYSRSDEVQHERSYSLDHVKSALAISGFELIEISSDLDGAECNEKTERWYFVCRAKKD